MDAPHDTESLQVEKEETVCFFKTSNLMQWLVHKNDPRCIRRFINVFDIDPTLIKCCIAVRLEGIITSNW